jgi:hypothetical protein
MNRSTRQLASRVAHRIRRAHRDQRGSISILSVFALLSFTMLLMMLVNVAKHVDDKVKMQNAADAAAYSGAGVIARGMNAIAFTNHLEADVFALTAFLREARERNAERYVPEILQAWVAAGSLFSAAEFPKFIPLPDAIARKALLEQEFVTAWGDMAAAAAEDALPAFEHILGTPETQDPQARDRLIPEFQRAVLRTVPQLAQDVTNEMALRHGLTQRELERMTGAMIDNPNQGATSRGQQVGVLWRTSVMPVGLADESDPMTRTLPVVDPDPYQQDYGRVPNGSDYLQEARRRRQDLARHYLREWIRDRDPRRGLDFAEEEVRMSQFARLFWAAACAQLDRLLNEEYPNVNVPVILRNWQAEWTNDLLEDDYMFVSVVYRRHVEEHAPRFFRNPLEPAADAQTFTQATVFIPRARFRCCPWGWWRHWIDANGTPQRSWIHHLDNWSHEWSTFNQNWSATLVPAVAESVPDILSSNPGGLAYGYRTPNLGSATIRDLNGINTH